MRRRAWRSLWIAPLAIAAAAALVEIVAAIRVRHLRAEREYLGDKLYVEERGTGDPVVFLAGLPATTRFWQGRFDSLAKSHRLIFIDALGFGRSPLPEVDYTLEDHLGALRRTLVALGASRRVTFIAHSFGTLLAAYYAARYPGEVEQLVLLGAPIFDGEREARAHIREVSSMSGVFTLNPLLAREACKLHEAANGTVLAQIVARFTPDIPPEVSREALLHTWRSFDGTLRNVLLRKSITVPLAQIGPKVTFVHGRADKITALSRIQALAEATGAGVLVTEDDHLSYAVRSADRIMAALRTAAAPEEERGERNQM